MNEEKLINQIQQLKTIRPDSNWVSSNKEEILGREMDLDWKLFFKPALVGASVFAVLFAFNISQDSLPGEMLFTLKKLTEQKNIVLSSDNDKPILNLELANKRLEELYLIAERNDVQKIAPAINEFQNTMEDVNEELSRVYVTNQDVDDQLIQEANELEETKENVGETLGAVIGGQAYDDYRVMMARLRIKEAEDLIEQLRLVVLTEEDKERLDIMSDELEQAKEYLNDNNCNPAFKIISDVLTEISNISKEKQLQ